MEEYKGIAGKVGVPKLYEEIINTLTLFFLKMLRY